MYEKKAAEIEAMPSSYEDAHREASKTIMNSAESRQEAIAKQMVKDHANRMEANKDAEREQQSKQEAKEDIADDADEELAKTLKKQVAEKFDAMNTADE